METDRGGEGGDERPNGSTVTPVSDIPTWLRCGGLGSKGYTTLSQVLTDANTLDGLMSDANAVNYLVRSTSWISDITSNQSAMTYIGANDYAAYKLLSNNTWLTSIADSSYMNLVLTKSVPAMTSNTTPEGEVFYSSSGSNLGWRAFNPSVRSGCYMNGGGPNGYLGYIFTSATNIFVADLYNHPNYNHAAKRLEAGPIVGSISFTPVSDYVSTPAGSHVKITTTKPPTAPKWRIYGKDPNSSYVYMLEMNFYGRTFGDIQSWLKAGKITDKSYTTLQQVLADSSTLQALMSSSDAVDYLRACGNWASTICANQSAMSYIGLNNYAANTLLTDATWLNAIIDSQYMDSVLNVKVPTMTGYTTPSGAVMYSSIYNDGYAPWKSFDNNVSTLGLVNKAVGGYLGYNFGSQKKIYAAKFYVHAENVLGKFQGSFDNATYVDLTEAFYTWRKGSSAVIPFSNINNYQYYRWYIPSISAADNAYGFKELQFYGRQDV